MSSLMAKADAEAEHSRLPEPARELVFARRIVERDLAHHCKAVRVLRRRFERVVIAVTVPGRRSQDRPDDTRGFHRAEQVFISQWNRPVRFRSIFFDVRPLWRLRLPNMNLGVDDCHRKTLSNRHQRTVIFRYSLGARSDRQKIATA